MHPIALHIGPLAIYWYGIFAALGFIAATSLLYLNRKYADITTDNVSDITFLAIISGVLGARLFYIVQFWSYFRYRPGEIIRIDHGGLVFYGGFICASTAIYIYCKKKKITISRVLDILAPSLALGHGLGRIGCFMNGCCYGKPSEVFCGVRFPEGSLSSQQYPGALLHPVQLYEAIFNFILAFILCFFLRKFKPGQTAASYFIIYGSGRFLIELFRGDHKDFILKLFTPAQFIGLFIIPIGIIVFIACSKAKK